MFWIIFNIFISKYRDEQGAKINQEVAGFSNCSIRGDPKNRMITLPTIGQSRLAIRPQFLDKYLREKKAEDVDLTPQPNKLPS